MKKILLFVAGLLLLCGCIALLSKNEKPINKVSKIDYNDESYWDDPNLTEEEKYFIRVRNNTLFCAEDGPINIDTIVIDGETRYFRRFKGIGGDPDFYEEALILNDSILGCYDNHGNVIGLPINLHYIKVI